MGKQGEVCDAIQGDYAVIVSEHNDEQYSFVVSGDGGPGNEAMSSGLYAHRDRTCRYWFRFSMGAGHIVRVHF